jgi:hypothetical protein
MFSVNGDVNKMLLGSFVKEYDEQDGLRELLGGSGSPRTSAEASSASSEENLHNLSPSRAGTDDTIRPSPTQTRSDDTMLSPSRSSRRRPTVEGVDHPRTNQRQYSASSARSTRSPVNSTYPGTSQGGKEKSEWG